MPKLSERIVPEDEWPADGEVYGVYTWDPRNCRYAGVVAQRWPQPGGTCAAKVLHGPAYKMTKVSIKEWLADALVTVKLEGKAS